MRSVSKAVQKWQGGDFGHRLGSLILLGVLSAVAVAESEPTTAEQASHWAELRAALFGEREIHEDQGVIGLDTPYRALDAAVVPIEVTALFPQTPSRYIQSLTLIIDQNPAPVAAVFHFPGRHAWDHLATRIRVDRYTHVRAIAETNDGQLHMAANFVKASGGCSAPAAKDPGAAAAELGRMKLLLPERPTPGERIRAQLLIRHPNSSGLQFDQVARHYIPADFVTSIEARHGDEPLFRVDANISISEDPSIHFDLPSEGLGDLTVLAKDSNGRVFEQRFEMPTRPEPRS